MAKRRRGVFEACSPFVNLVVISSYWPRAARKTPYFVVDQVRALTAAGHRVEVVVTTPPWRALRGYRRADELGLDAARVRVRQWIVPRLPERLGRAAWGARINIRLAGWWLRARLALRRLRRVAVDSVLVHGERSIGLSIWLWSRGLSCPKALVIHGIDPVLERHAGSRWLHDVARRASKAVRSVIVVGSPLRRYIVELGFEDGRIRVIPNGFIGPNAIPGKAARQRDDSATELIGVGRLIEQKGIGDTIRALGDLRRRRPELDWRYRIVGAGPDRDELGGMVAELGLEERVVFEGFRALDDVFVMLAGSDVFVLPSWNEAFGLVYLEAMAFGCAVIGCRGNGPEDIIRDGFDGLLVAPRDIDAISSAVERLICDPGFRRKLAREGRRTVSAYTWERNAGHTLAALGVV